MRMPLDPKIVNQPKKWGWNYDSTVGDSHNGEADKISKQLVGPVDININLDPDKSKPSSLNPGVDKGFLAKGNPQKGTVGEGLLTRSCRD